MIHLLLATLIGCPAPAYDGSAGTPSIQMLFPVSSLDTVYCPIFTVVVDVDGYILSSENYGDDHSDGEGHWHMTEGSEMLGTASADFYTLTQPLDEGEHAILVFLVQNNHQDYDFNGEAIEWLTEIMVEDSEDCVGTRTSDSGSETDDTGV
jgi:hypothetical protein